MRFPRARTTPEATFDLTNLIDVVLLLIIFFMLTAQFAKSTQQAMDLPREKGDQASPESGLAVVIELTRDGAFHLGGTEVALDRLQQLVAADARRANRNPDAVEITIRAERSCPAGHLNRLIAALSQLGVKTWKLATVPEEGGA